MYLLYLDESGNEKDPSDKYFVLAGIALFERQTYYLSNALENIQERYFPKHQPIIFHASEIRSGRKFWRGVPRPTRLDILSDIASEICNVPEVGRVLFGAAIEKTDILWAERAVEKATEQICSRFDRFLQRKYHQEGDAQRGLLIFSEGRLDARAKVWVRGFRQRGTTWGTIRNLADIPYFASMGESRLLQVADFIAHAAWLLYEKRDVSLVRSLVPFFDNDDGILHGLAHVRADPQVTCSCPACMSRRSPGDFGTWL